MAQPTDLSSPAIHGPYAALATHPAYYPLYALYADYARNATRLRRQEYAALLQQRMRTLQPLLALVQPYRKSPALRLFTERASLERFPPHRVDEAWRQLRELIDRIGAPPGWEEGALPPPPEHTHRPRQTAGAPPAPTDAATGAPRRRPATRSPAPEADGADGADGAAAAPSRRKPRPFKSPVDYSQEV